MRLFEKYRPTTLADVVGQPKAVALVSRLLAAGVGGQAVWITGASGTGKTTLAKIITAAHCPREAVRELDTADDLRTEDLDEMDNAITFRPLWGARERRAWIINEAHGLRASAMRRLLGILERIAADPDGRLLVVFTTTRDGEDDLFGNSIDASPLLSRCSKVPLTNQGLAQAFAEMFQRVAIAEHLDGQPLAAYVKLAQRVKNNGRAGLVEIENGCMMTP